jgi:hypothetical protein
MKTALYWTLFLAFVVANQGATNGFRGRPSGNGMMGSKNSTRPLNGKPAGKNSTKLENCTDGGNHTQGRNRTGGHH